MGALTDVPYGDPNLQEAIVRLTARGRIVDVLYGVYTLNFSNIATQATGTETVSLPGLRANDFCILGTSGGLNGLSPACFYSADDTASIRMVNNTGSGIDLGSQVFTVLAFKIG